MPGIWLMVKGRVRRLLHSLQMNPNRWWTTRLSILPLEDRIVPAYGVDPALFQALRTAVADLNGDGVPDLLSAGNTVAGAVNGANGSTLFSITPFGQSYGGPLTVAARDVNNDGKPEIALGAGQGGGARVQVLNGVAGAVLFDKFVYAPSFTGGVSVALGDVTGDGIGDLITAAGFRGGPHIRIFDGASNFAISTSFFAYDPNYRGGVNVVVGDLDGDGVAEIVTGTGPGGGAHVRVFDGRTLQATYAFFSADPNNLSGTEVGVGDVDGNGLADIVTYSADRLRAYSGRNATPFIDINFANPLAQQVPTGHALSVTDFNGDGFGELLLSDRFHVTGSGGDPAVRTGFNYFPGQSPGAFAKAPPTPPATVFSGEAVFVPGTGVGTITANRLRAYTTAGSTVRVFPVDDVSGTLGTLVPGDAGYTVAALTNAKSLFSTGSANAILDVEAGRFYGLAITSGATTLVSFSKANPGGTQQFRFLSRNRFAAEEGVNGGDRDFNDAIGELAVTAGTTPPGDGNFPNDLTGFITTITGGTTGTATVTNNRLTLSEGDSFRVAVSKVFTVPASPTVVQVAYEVPFFDSTSQGNIRDAFEVAVLGANGAPLALPIADERDASFNASEGLGTLGGPGTTTATGIVRINLASLPAGTQAQVVLRLVNNDTDNLTSVVINRIDFLATLATAPTGVTPVIEPGSAGAVDFTTLNDVSPSVKAAYGRTTLTDENTILTTALSLRNVGTYAVGGRVLLAIANLSDPAVSVLHADGVTPDGLPYFDFTKYLTNGVLNAAGVSAARTLQFINPNRERFTFEIQVLAGLNHAPVITSTPTLQIEATHAYSYDANATDVDGQSLAFSLIGKPDGMMIDAASGIVSWATTVADVGNHTVRIRVTDTLGATAEQSFTLAVIADIPNRPPVFISTPITDAKVAGVFEVTTVKVGDNPVGIAGAKFDGKTVSVVTANAGDGNLTVGANTVSLGEPVPIGLLLQQGSDIDLGLPPFVDSGDVNGLLSFVQGDFNSDGAIDFVTSTFDRFYNATVGTVREQKVQIILGGGDSTFATPALIPHSLPSSDIDHLFSLLARDVDTDGTLDIIASYYNESTTTGANAPKLVVWRGKGDGTFNAPILTDTGGLRFNQIRAGDFNRDGYTDLVAVRDTNNEAGILLGIGDGHFGPYTVIVDNSKASVSSGFYYPPVVGDLDGVNGDDIVIPDYQQQQLLLFRNDGLGGFTDTSELPVLYPFYPYGPSAAGRPQTVSVADFDGDTHTDIVYTTFDGGLSGGGIGIFKGSGDGKAFTFASAGQGLPRRPVSYGSDDPAVDINADGKPDLILGTQNGIYGVTAAINKGDGTFALQTYQNPVADRDYGRSPYQSDIFVSAGDYNLDGVIDVAVGGTRADVNYGDAFAGLSILYGQSPGLLAAPTDFNFSLNLSYAPFTGISYANDFNNDGNVDLFGIFYQAGSKIRFGNGDGTFQDPVAAAPNLGNEFYGSGFSADFNRDGYQDVIWWSGGGVQGGPPGRILIGFNDGTGAFSMIEKRNPDTNYYYVGGLQEGDFNGDGYPDFAGHLGSAVDIWLYDPVAKNNFVRSQRLALPFSGPAGVLESADFNGDGITDIIAGVARNGNDPDRPNHTIQFFAGNGDGTFAAAVEQKLWVTNSDVFDPKWSVSGDLNEDGIRDLIITSAYSRSSVFLGNGDGTFGPHADYATGTYYGSNRQAYLQDSDGDGHLDFIALNDNANGRHRIVIRRGYGDGTFGPEESYSGGGNIILLDFADVDNDGKTDIIAGTSLSNYSFSTVYNGTTPGLTSVATGDFNGDGIQDTIASTGNNARVKLLFGNGDNTFSRQFDLLVGKGTAAVAAHDYDGDGDLDIVTANKAGRSVTVLTNNGKGVFTRADVSVGKLLTAMATGELTGDSLGDFVVASDSANAIFVLTSSASGLSAPVAFPTGEAPGELAIGDATGDGINDVIVSLPGSKRLMILPGDGNGGFATPLYVNLKTAVISVGLADFNADGKPDLAVTLPDAGQAAILFGRGAGRFATPQTIRVGEQPGALAIQDVNGDGRPDILVANAGDGTASIIINRYDPTNLYRYTAKATDPDGDAVMFDLLDAPGGMILGDNGEILWAPTADQIGLNAVTVQASDGNGGFATQSFTIAVQASRDNGVPNIFSTAPATLDGTKTYSYTPTSIDPDGDTLRYRLLSGPAGASVDPFTGEVTWDPRNGALQTYRNFDNYGYVVVPKVPLLTSSSLTLEGWFRFDKNTGNQVLFSQQGYSLQYLFGQLRVGITDSTGESVVATTWQPAAGQWYHFAMAFDDATGAVTLLVDGQIATTAFITRHIQANGNPLYIGGTGNGNFVGVFSQVRIWNVARTPEEIRADVVRDIAPGTPGLIANYRFNNGESLTIRDSSGNAVDGRLAAQNALPFNVPGFADEQTQYFTIQVEDGKGGVTTQSFGVTIVPPLTSSITGKLFVDISKDGVQNNGEVGMLGAVVFTDDNFNGIRDVGEAFAHSDAKGNYTITGLNEGRYYLTVEPKAGYFVGYPQIVIVPRTLPATVNLPVEALALGQIRGTVKIDSNGNGTPREAQPVYASDFNAATPNLAAWSANAKVTASPDGTKFLGEYANSTVMLNVGGDSPLAPHDTLTISFDLHLLRDWEGSAFSRNDKWAVGIDGKDILRTTFSNYNGYVQAYPNSVVDGITNPYGTGATAKNTLGIFPTTTYHLTFTVPHTDAAAVFSFGGTNLPGSLNPSWAISAVTVTASEPAATGWPVYLDENNNTVRDANEATTLTDANGDYAFNGLYANTWPVRIENPSGWTTTTPVTGIYNVVLATDAVSTGNDFVIVPSAAAASQPRFVTQPHDYDSARNAYRFANVAFDPGFRPITYSLQAGPEGMAIDPATGVVVWTPSLDQVGEQSVILKAVNDRGGVALQAFTITVGRPNSDPIITSTPPVAANPDVLLQYDVLAQDTENPVLGYALESSPSGAVIDSKTGRVTWTPTAGQLGPQQFTVFVEDFEGGVARQSFELIVTPGTANTNPVVLGGVRSTTAVGVPLFGQILGSDADGDPIAFNLVAGPAGMSVDSEGHLNWTPTAAQFGLNNVTIQADDGRSGFSSRDFVIDVRSIAANTSPKLSSVPASFAVANRVYKYDVVAVDAEGDPLRFEVVSGPAGLSIDPLRGTVRWNPAVDQFGQNSVTLRVMDSLGGTAEQNFIISVHAVGGPPAIISVPPVTASVGNTYLYSVLAQDAESDPLTYTLLTSPSGMTLDAITGELQWTPDNTQLGSQSVSIQVSDGTGGFATQTFAIVVAIGAANLPPVITSLPPTGASAGTAYTHTIVATDPEGSAVTFEKRRGPAGLIVNPTTGVVTWTPTATDIGTVIVAFAALDASGAAAVQSFELEVLSANVAPVIVSLAPLTVPARGLYRYDILASDANLDPLTYELTTAPAGMTVDAFGRVRWQTGIADLGGHLVTVVVRDPRGGSVTQSFTLGVMPDTSAPRVSVIPTSSIVRANDASVYAQFNLTPVYTTNTVRVTAIDNVAVTDLVVTANGKAVALDARGLATFNFADWGFGTITVTAKASDAAGNFGIGSKPFAFVPYGDDSGGPTQGNPQAVITSPAASDSVLGFVTITGTASSDNFTGYTLTVRRAADGGVAKTIAAGTSKVEGSTLGTWDTTLLENDEYILRLEVNDDIFGMTAYEQSVGVSGNFKLGNFRLSFADLTISVAGIPITLARTYDTLRSDREGDVGFGWRLEYRNADLRTSLPKSNLEDIGIYTPFKSGVKVYVTLPGGDRLGFTFTPEIRVLPGFGNGNNLVVGTPKFTPDRGNKFQLQVQGGGFLVNEFGDFYASAGLPYNPASDDFGGGYTVVSPDGLRYRIDGDTGLLDSATDRNGNTLTFTDAGVSGQGANLTFERDAKDRITRVIDPAGNSVRYGYDAAGNLVRVTDRVGNVTTLTYKTSPAHYLDKVIDPLGREGVKATYGPDGRLTTTTDANGHSVFTTYDPDNSLLRTTDALGHTSIAEYDAQGNLVTLSDPLGRTTRLTYDADNNLISQTDPLGRVTRFSFNADGNLLSTTDPLGNVIRFTPDSFGQTTSVTDPLGNTSTFRYDSHGNPVSQTDAAGHTTKFTVDTAGNILSITDPLGATSTTAYDTSGNRTRIVDAGGLATDMAYDANGKMTSQATPGSVAWNLTYDAEGQVTRYQIGTTSRQLTYDASSRLTGGTNSSGQMVGLQSDAAGNLMGLAQSGVGVSSQLDAAGNVIASTDILGNTTSYEFDDAGQTIAVIDADGTRETFAYNDAGEVITRTDKLGHATHYEYDGAGRKVKVIDALGGISLTAYNANGKVIATTSPSGLVTQYTYDSLGQLVTTLLPEGVTRHREYDAVGRLISELDAQNRGVYYQYSAEGSMVAATDAAGHVTRYGYDAIGRLTTVTDHNGNVTHATYDSNGRLLTSTDAAGVTSTSFYSELGQLIAVTAGTGQTVSTTYTGRGLASTVTLPDGSTTTKVYTTDGLPSQVIDATGTRTFDYDPLTRQPVRVTEPDGRSVRYEYDAVGQRTALITRTAAGVEAATHYAYDDLGRILRVTDPQGGVTTYAYAQYRLATITRPNGVTTAYQYDSIGQVMSIVHRDPISTVLASFVYTYDPSSNQTSVITADGSRTEFAYDAANRLTSEAHFDPANLSTGVTTYAYDAAGNLIHRGGSLGTADFTYNADNQLLTGDGKTNTYDAAGNLATTTDATGTTHYTYDALGRLTGIESATGVLTAFTYDLAGNRLTQTIGGITTRYLLDRFAPEGLAQVVVESDAGGAVLRSYVNLDTTAEMSDSGGTRYFLTDALGSTRALTDAAGTVTDSYVYSAFGELVQHAGTSANPIRFAGQSQDANGLYYLRARYYDPAAGRFLSRDPQAGDSANPVSFSPYQYAANNPITNTDPSGRVTLIELQVAISEQTALRGQQLANFRKGLVTVSKLTADAARYFGGLLSLAAALDSFDHLGNDILFFGLSFPFGVLNTGKIGFDLLGARPITFHLYDAQWTTAYAQKNGGVVPIALVAGSAGRSTPGRAVDIALLPSFFVITQANNGPGPALAFGPRPPLPIVAQGIGGTPSMAGIMVHEFAHITVDAVDDAYEAGNLVARDANGFLFSELKNPETNADNYRVYVRAQAIGYYYNPFTNGTDFLQGTLSKFFGG